ncbi:unnamed protein product [Thelazia callipaeda]|uniref:Ge1_WD40 domain-containing protein n=1 Tax=Thelazia callipaeda TaxID=103827 RepID=A0A0N5D7M2_THECL|nr:unnamed protein product [Thelazia callipaeda]
MTGEQIDLNDISPVPTIIERYVLDGSDAIVNFTGGREIMLNAEKREDVRFRDRDSSRVYTQILSEYKWASEECYKGRILAVHGNLVAYRLFNENTGEAVRVLERLTAKRHLIKSFKHPTADLQWAHHAPLLTVIDVNANIYVYHVDKDCVVTKYLNIIRHDHAIPFGASPRISWCPYIPEPDELHDEVHMIAVYYHNKVEAVSLGVIKSELNCEEVTLEQCEKLNDAIMELPIESSTAEVQAVCLSPDATAIAVALSSGAITFFIIDSEGTKFAHRWQPEHGRHIQDLIFLDNITSQDTPDQFWKYAIISTEDGKRIQLYDTENWSCIARLLFEPLDQLGKLVLSVHPTAQYIFLSDYDAAIIYCVEIAYVMNTPHFVACTQITFCNPLVSIAPISVFRQEPHQEFSLSDEFPVADVLVSFVALSQRSLLYLEIGLEKSMSQNAIEGSVADNNSQLEMMYSNAGSGSDRNDVTSSDKVENETQDRNHLDFLCRHWENLSTKVEKQAEEFGKRFEDERHRTDSHFHQLREEIVSCDDRLLSRLELLINENKKSILEAMQSSLNAKVDNMLQDLRSAAGDNFGVHFNYFIIINQQQQQQQQQQAIDAQAIRKEIASNIKETLVSAVIPVIQDVCVSLFRQLNETFRTGLEQYMQQVHALCVNTLKPAHIVISDSVGVPFDRTTLMNLIENHRVEEAFDKALMANDFEAVMFICKKFDADSINTMDHPLSQITLLRLLNHLASKLEGETDLKYIENVLIALHPKDPVIVDGLRHVIDRLQTSLTAFIGANASSNWKRRARMISQLAVNMMK